MIVRNRSTKKNHELLRANWDKMSDKNKSLFDIIEPNDSNIEIKVVGDLKPNGKTHNTNKPKTDKT